MASINIEVLGAMIDQVARRIQRSLDISVGEFLKLLDDLEAADFAEFCEHPDVAEMTVATASWYPEVAQPWDES